MHFSQKWILLKSPEANKYHRLIFSYNPKWNPLQLLLSQPGMVSHVCAWPCFVKGWCAISIQGHALWFQNSLWGFGVLILRSYSWTSYRGALYEGKVAGKGVWRSKAWQNWGKGECELAQENRVKQTETINWKVQKCIAATSGKQNRSASCYNAKSVLL